MSRICTIAIILALVLNACSSYTVDVYKAEKGYAPSGRYYARYKETLDITELERSSKKGSSVCACFFGLVAFGDASVSKAMMDGRVRHIRHVDASVFKVSFWYFLDSVTIYERYETVVYGE